jgi:predicted DNA-binding protein (UPF0251 family)
MARPKCARRVREFSGSTFFKPRGIPLSELAFVTLTFDECEALRLADLEGLYHDGAASRMHISRATFGRIIEAARRKVAEALIHGKAIRIEGGVVKMAPKRKFECCDCGNNWEVPFGTGRPEACPKCAGTNLQRADRPGGGRRGGSAGCRMRRSTSARSTRRAQ